MATENLDSSLESSNPSVRTEIDTSAPFESVKEAANRFGGMGFWKPISHKPSELPSEFDDYKNDLRQVIHGNDTTDGIYITLRMRLDCQIFRNGKAMPGKIFDVLNGVIVATPTGSTAYSTAAGGSMVHPNDPCMLFTPICPHSLSFRPVILSDSALLELKILDDARSNALVSFDGKRRQQRDSIRISMSQHPLPTVNKSDQTGDWFT